MSHKKVNYDEIASTYNERYEAGSFERIASTLNSLIQNSTAQRILEVEHQVLPRTIQLYAQGRLKIEGRKVKILPGDSWLNNQEKNSGVLYSEGY